MIKRVSFLLFLLVPLVSLAQLQLGLKPGYTLYWLTAPQENMTTIQYDYSHSTYSVAFTAKEKVTKDLYVCAELSYTGRSFGVTSTWIGVAGGYSFDYNYTLGNIYLQIQPQCTFGSRVKFFIYPGFYLSTLLNSSIEGTKEVHTYDPPVVIRDTINGSAKDYYQSFEFGFCAGAGVDVPLNDHLGMVFESNFTMNLNPIGESWGSEKARMLNLRIAAGITYTFISKNMK
jgi:hypothetical protein